PRAAVVEDADADRETLAHEEARGRRGEAAVVAGGVGDSQVEDLAVTGDRQVAAGEGEGRQEPRRRGVWGSDVWEHVALFEHPIRIDRMAKPFERSVDRARARARQTHPAPPPRGLEGKALRRRSAGPAARGTADPGAQGLRRQGEGMVTLRLAVASWG